MSANLKKTWMTSIKSNKSGSLLEMARIVVQKGQEAKIVGISDLETPFQPHMNSGNMARHLEHHNSKI